MFLSIEGHLEQWGSPCLLWFSYLLLAWKPQKDTGQVHSSVLRNIKFYINVFNISCFNPIRRVALPFEDRAETMKWQLDLILGQMESHTGKWKIKMQVIINIFLKVACNEEVLLPVQQSFNFINITIESLSGTSRGCLCWRAFKDWWTCKGGRGQWRSRVSVKWQSHSRLLANPLQGAPHDTWSTTMCVKVESYRVINFRYLWLLWRGSQVIGTTTLATRPTPQTGCLAYHSRHFFAWLVDSPSSSFCISVQYHRSSFPFVSRHVLLMHWKQRLFVA